MGTRSRRRLATLGGALALLTLSACEPGAPPGVDKAALDEAVSRAVGDPNTCVLIAEAGSGRVLYRYNTATACDRAFPDCDGPGTMKTKDLLATVAKDGLEHKLSCNTVPDASRGVGWAAGPIEGRDWVYAAMMEGDRVFPGMMMADRLKSAFRRAKVSAGTP